ncbi:hypothetical protein RPMA_01340 [Tardiphaga alba]|uniref:Uncharacterized protein n=1 Tax=Tardiphaga alba TaxID=340268 RepID=A0ABX8A3E5_9BRAD|nr:hypothetical protein [Tardiphaga alba]QUS37657.1 hypothetical protein RPMA_01340 [Tardiphaga alba]
MPRFSFLPNAVSHATSDVDVASFTAICLASCKRLPAMRRTAEAKRLDRLVESGAWTDAALALIAIELPDWQLRRLTFDDGEWHCALSTERNMPDWLDDAVETHHADMATAILDAFRSAVARNGRSHLTAVPASNTPRSDFMPMMCENYC